MKKLILEFTAIVVTVLVLFQNLIFSVKIESPTSKYFSGENAFKHLENIATEPRRMYQPYYNKARQYIINELEKLEIEPEFQQTTSLEHKTPVFYSSVDNILARIEGTSDNEDILLLVAHFDSEPFVSPGAGDDAGSCAALLELARVLKSSVRLKNDIVLLFSIPEEPGCQGATAFITQHPLAKKVKLVFNFEGIGTGKFFLHTTNSNNDWLMKEYAKGCQSSMAYSYVTAFDPYPAKDGTVFKRAGYSVLELTTFYPYPKLWHSLHDNLSVITLSSLQENGNKMLDLIRHFGNININVQNQSKLVFYEVLNTRLIYFPRNIVVPLTLIITLITLYIIIIYLRRRIVRFKNILYAFVLLIIACASVFGITNLIWYIITNFHPRFMFLFNGSPYDRLWFYSGFTILSFFVINGSFLLASSKIKNLNDSIAPSVLCFISVILIITSLLFKDIAGILLAAIIPLQVMLLARLFLRKPLVVHLLLNMVYAFVTITLLVPFIINQFQEDDGNILKPVSGILFAIFLLPLLFEIFQERKKIFSLITGTAAIILIGVPLMGDYEYSKPKVTYVSCYSDADNNKYAWYVRDLYGSGFDEYSKQFLKENQIAEPIKKYIPTYPYQFDGYFTEIHNVVFNPPTLEVLRDSLSGEYRYLELKIKSMRNAWEISVFKNRELEVGEYSIDGIKCESLFGQKFVNTDSLVLCNYRNPRKDGITLSLKVKAGEKILLKVRDRTYGIPMELGMQPMPEYMIPWVDYGANSTTVTKTFTL